MEKTPRLNNSKWKWHGLWFCSEQKDHHRLFADLLVISSFTLVSLSSLFTVAVIDVVVVHSLPQWRTKVFHHNRWYDMCRLEVDFCISRIREWRRKKWQERKEWAELITLRYFKWWKANCVADSVGKKYKIFLFLRMFIHTLKRFSGHSGERKRSCLCGETDWLRPAWSGQAFKSTHYDAIHFAPFLLVFFIR